jgi:hypothetical protein
MCQIRIGGESANLSRNFLEMPKNAYGDRLDIAQADDPRPRTTPVARPASGRNQELGATTTACR